MANTRDLLVKINGDTSGFEKAFGRATNQSGKFSGAVDKVKDAAKFLAVGVGVATGAAVLFGKASVNAYNSSVEASAKLKTNLLNVKGATDANVKSLEKLAAKLQGVGVIEDDVIKAGMSQLATFNLQGDTIEKLTPKIADMVAQLKGHNATAEDMMTINNLVGKVMTGNVGALSKYGVSLSESQKQLLNQGDEAQRAAVLNEVLAQNYGKVNEALRNTPQGQLTALKNTWGDFQELIGEFVSKIVGPLVTGMNDWFTSMGGPEGVLESLKLKVKELHDAIWPVISAIRDYLEPKFVALWSSIKDKLLPAVSDLAKAIGPALGAGLVGAFGLAIDMANALITVLSPVIEWMSKHTDVVWAAVAAWATLRVTMGIVGIVSAVQGAIAGLTAVMGGATAATGGLNGTLAFLAGPAGGFALVAAAAVAAGVIITRKWSQTMDTINNTKNAIASLKSSTDIVTARMNKLYETGKLSMEQLYKLQQAGVVNDSTNKIYKNQNTYIPGYATGTDFHKGGWAMVGERGPELINLPRGSEVIPNNELAGSFRERSAVTSAPAQQTTIEFAPKIQVGMFAGMPTEYREMAERMWVEFTRIAQSNGVKLPSIGARVQ